MIWLTIFFGWLLFVLWAAVSKQGRAWTAERWAWWNPYDFSKGFVDGGAMREKERTDFEQQVANDAYAKELNEQIERDVAAAAKVIKENAFRDARLKELRDSIAAPTPPKKAALFAGSKVTKLNKPAKVVRSRSTIIGTVEAGVGPAPANYPSKVDTRRPGAVARVVSKLKGISG